MEALMEKRVASPPVRIRKKKYTYEDYARMTPPDSGNYELHDGKIVFMPSPIPSHQDAAGYIYRKMADHAESNHSGRVFIAPLDTKFDDINTLQPDVLFIAAERRDIIGAKKIDGAPDLVVEVLSGSNTAKEMSYKKYVYESYGVQEYWVVNLIKRTLTQLINHDGEFIPADIWTERDTCEAKVLPGFRLEVAKVLPEKEG